MSHARTSIVVAVIAVIAAVALSGQSASPPVDPTLAELRAMRADLNERLETNIRVQLLVARLTLQEQRTSDVVRQLSDVSEKMRTHEQTKAQMGTVSKMFGDLSALKPEEQEKNFLFSTLKGQMDAMEKADTDLKQQHAELTNALGQEQARWAAFNAQLAELERLFEKPRR